MALSLLDRLRARRAARAAARAVGKPQYRTVPASSVPPATPARTPSRPHRTGPIARLVNRWWNRLLQSVYEGSLSEQEAQYEEGSTTRDYLWNTIGTSVWGFTFPLLTVVATQLAGVEGAGMFSMAFVVGTLLMIASNYGIRNYQVSDIEEANSFSSYQINRWLTGIVALAVGALYCALRDYDASMTTICAGVFVYKVLDGVAVLLFVPRSLEVASVGMAIAAAATFVLVTVPLALLETEKSRPASMREVARLFTQGFPLFCALFMFNLIESMPKFVMEGSIAYENQLYFNALYFPAQGILLATGFIYKPQLVRLASIWSNPRKRRRFDLIIGAVVGVVVIISIVCGIFLGSIGIPLMSFMYGVDFEQFRPLAYCMVAAGGVTAVIDFLYAIITVLRRQGDVIRLYLIAFAASVALPLALVNLFGLAGAVASYLAVMALLLCLLVWQYAQIRKEITRRADPFA